MKKIALVEDDADERLFIKRAIAQADQEVEVIDYVDGQEALDSLLELKEKEEFPSLVIIDLKLPLLSGLEVLKHLRAALGDEPVPLVICSGSSAKTDVLAAWKEGCSGYLVKPSNPQDYRDLVQTLMNYWFSSHQRSL